MINFDDKNSKETHWVSLFIDKNTAAYIDCFDIEYIPQEVLSQIKDKYITHNIFRIQEDDWIMCEFSFIAFMESMLSRKALLDNTNLFSPNNNRKQW